MPGRHRRARDTRLGSVIYQPFPGAGWVRVTRVAWAYKVRDYSGQDPFNPTYQYDWRLYED